MAGKRCPGCGLINPGSAERCDCGRSFIDGTMGLELKDRLAAPNAFVERPAGLTILAIMNLVFGGIGAIWLVGLLQLVADASDKHFFAPPELFYASFVMSLVSLLLIISAGVGYFMQKRWGRTLGNLYAAVSLMSGFIAVVVVHDLPRWDLVVGVGYPTLTLILINTRFKAAMVN